MGQNNLLKVPRLEALTDGIFAIAMTILILDLHLPTGISFQNLPITLSHVILLKLGVYAGSFIILGTLWVAMNFQLGLLDRLNRLYLWTNIFYLMVICVVPFSASLLAAYPNNPTSITFYAINLIAASFGQFLTSQCAHYFNLNKKLYSTAIRRAVVQRIIVAPLFYVTSLITAHWSTTLAFMFLLAPTLIYMWPGKVDKFDK